MERHASAVWKGSLKEGKGTVSTESGVLNAVPYKFSTRFENEKGTNPEELIGAAHSGCFSMAFSGQLDKAGLKAESIETRASVKMEKEEVGWTVKAVHLDVVAKVPGAPADAVQKAGENAKNGCPISRLLSPGAKVTMSLKVA
ncbi:MAG TPA: OsmC family protein [Candidatus Thermoplasmatota archaeon]|nr:OsmC family protein [Candidatus Thermoplasmatota archaeon]